MIDYADAKPATISDLEEILVAVKESVLEHSTEYDESSRDHARICCAASMIQMAIDGLNHVGGLVCVIRSHLDTIAESLTELAYGADSSECYAIMCAVESIQEARDLLDDVGAA